MQVDRWSAAPSLPIKILQLKILQLKILQLKIPAPPRLRSPLWGLMSADVRGRCRHSISAAKENSGGFLDVNPGPRSLCSIRLLE
jgi:hypothetical protein